MTKIYACLLGEWVCLNDDDTCTIDEKSPVNWWKESPGIYAPFQRQEENSFNEYDYVNISYNGRHYRINPIFIQIVTD